MSLSRPSRNRLPGGWWLLLASLVAWPVRGEEETPFTRLFDTQASSAEPLAESVVSQRAGWTLVPEDKVRHTFSGDIALLNDKLTVVLRKQGRGAEVYARTPRGVKFRARIGHAGAPTLALDPADAFKVVENSSSAVVVEGAFRSGTPAAAQFRLTTGEAILEIRPGAGAQFLGVQTHSRCLVVPDYFGDDLVFETRASTPTPAAPRNAPNATGPRGGSQCLPAENICLSLLEGGDAVLMTVWQSSQQVVSLSNPRPGQADGLSFSAVQCLGSNQVWLAFLEAPGLWHASETPANDGWQPPFPAKWRCSYIRENHLADSWDRDRGPQPDQTSGSHQGPMIVYPLDRTTATPLTATCPTDVMRNTLGVGPCQYILACEGLSGQGDPTPNSVMSWVEKQFEGKKERKTAEDIKERLQQMAEHVAHARTRVEQYAAFARQVRQSLATEQGLDSFRGIVADLDRSVALGLGPAGSPECARQWAAEVCALIGQENPLPACQRLGEQLRSLGALQDRALAQCRSAVRRLRQQDRTLVSQPPTGGGAEAVRRAAEQVLQRK